MQLTRERVQGMLKFLRDHYRGAKYEHWSVCEHRILTLVGNDKAVVDRYCRLERKLRSVA